LVKVPTSFLLQLWILKIDVLYSFLIQKSRKIVNMSDMEHFLKNAAQNKNIKRLTASIKVKTALVSAFSPFKE